MPQKDQSFWISYSDLSTGLMMVFLLVTTIFALKQLMQERAKQVEVERLVNDVSELTTMRLRLAEELNERLGDMEGVEVDLVTAQVTVAHDALGFRSGSPHPERTDFLQRFIHPYSCALIAFEQGQCQGECDRLDPRSPKAVRRILVTGHADLVSDFVSNRILASQRAENVIQSALGIAASGSCDEWAIGSYLENRFQPAAAGQIAHCLEVTDGDSRELCSALPQSRRMDSPRNRTVTFEVELVGEDLSGMALNLVALDATVSENASTKDLIEILEPMLEACVREERPSSECAPIRVGSGALQRSEPLRAAVVRACDAAANDASPDYCQQQ